MGVEDILLGFGVLGTYVKTKELEGKLRTIEDSLGISIKRYVLEPQTMYGTEEKVLGEWSGTIIVFNFYLGLHEYVLLKFETPYETHQFEIFRIEDVKGYSLVKIAFNYVKLTARNIDPFGNPQGTPPAEVFVINIPRAEVIP